MSLLSSSWRDVPWIAFDTETTGRYPVESEICEIAAVKWQGGKEVGTYSALVKPTRRMSEEVIRIHGITNEMVADKPSVQEVLPGFSEFIKGGVLLAHHAQFDLGFVASQLEDSNLPLPIEPAVCTSLLAQATVPETPNHKLQTLVPFFGIDPGQAHRALDDARSCLGVALKMFERLEAQTPGITVEQIAAKMLRRTSFDLGVMYFSRFSIRAIAGDPNIARFINAARKGEMVDLVYAGGSRPGQARKIQPIGVIRQLDGDALVALEFGERTSKRYWLRDVQAIV